jgi:hypothetical protein
VAMRLDDAFLEIAWVVFLASYCYCTPSVMPLSELGSSANQWRCAAV